jgi:hypothetical protein
MQFGGLVLLLALGIVLLGLYDDGEDGMRSRGFGVHVCGSHRPVAEAQGHVLLHGGDAVNCELCEILDEDAFISALFELHSSFDIFR